MRIIDNIIKGLNDICAVWRDEMKSVLGDEGVLIFFVLVPLAYPLLYSWIYNNETVREVPVVVVDQSNSVESRQFVRMADASCVWPSVLAVSTRHAALLPLAMPMVSMSFPLTSACGSTVASRLP